MMRALGLPHEADIALLAERRRLAREQVARPGRLASAVRQAEGG
jgi:hypothetical protein